MLYSNDLDKLQDVRRELEVIEKRVRLLQQIQHTEDKLASLLNDKSNLDDNGKHQFCGNSRCLRVVDTRYDTLCHQHA